MKNLEPFYCDYQATACEEQDIQMLKSMMEREGWTFCFAVPSQDRAGILLVLFERLILKTD